MKKDTPSRQILNWASRQGLDIGKVESYVDIHKQLLPKPEVEGSLTLPTPPQSKSPQVPQLLKNEPLSPVVSQLDSGSTSILPLKVDDENRKPIKLFLPPSPEELYSGQPSIKSEEELGPEQNYAQVAPLAISPNLAQYNPSSSRVDLTAENPLLPRIGDERRSNSRDSPLHRIPTPLAAIRREHANFRVSRSPPSASYPIRKEETSILVPTIQGGYSAQKRVESRQPNHVKDAPGSGLLQNAMVRPYILDSADMHIH